MQLTAEQKDGLSSFWYLHIYHFALLQKIEFSIYLQGPQASHDFLSKKKSSLFLDQAKIDSSQTSSLNDEILIRRMAFFFTIKTSN